MTCMGFTIVLDQRIHIITIKFKFVNIFCIPAIIYRQTLLFQA